MTKKRKENPQWQESDVCMKCTKPFFWNFKVMWEKRVVGKRQHHCRHCGAAICDDCSRSRSSIPMLGHEFQVRICSTCTSKISDNEKSSLATFHDSKHGIVYMNYDDLRKYLLTVGNDRIVKIWDVSSILVQLEQPNKKKTRKMFLILNSFVQVKHFFYNCKLMQPTSLLFLDLYFIFFVYIFINFF